MAVHRPKVSIVGAGTVGSTLALALHEQGYPIVSVISRTGSNAINLARLVECKRASTEVSDIVPRTEILFLTVPDDAISHLAGQIANVKKLKIEKMLVLHCSGVYSSDVLAPLRSKGATVASMHPIQTFPKSQRFEKLKAKLRGISYGIDGESSAVARVSEIVRDLDGRVVVVPGGMKPLYHVACVFASNYMTVFLNTIAELSRTLKLTPSWMEVFGPLMTTTMENVVKDSAGSAVTGPIVRGDLGTIEKHLDALSKFAPQILPLYTINGIELARVAKQCGRISPEEFDRIVATFKVAIQSTPKQPKEKH